MTVVVWRGMASATNLCKEAITKSVHCDCQFSSVQVSFFFSSSAQRCYTRRCKRGSGRDSLYRPFTLALLYTCVSYMFLTTWSRQNDGVHCFIILFIVFGGVCVVDDVRANFRIIVHDERRGLFLFNLYFLLLPSPRKRKERRCGRVVRERERVCAVVTT